jgi:hemerythrin
METHYRSADPAINIDLLHLQHAEINLEIQRLKNFATKETSGEAFSLWISRFGDLLFNHFEAEEELLRHLGLETSRLEQLKKEHSRLLTLHFSLVESMMHGHCHPLDCVANLFSSEIMSHISEHDSEFFF